MSAVFFNITGTVLVLNILFLIIPDGKFSKYVQFVAGLIVILTVAGNFIHISLDHSLIHFDEEAFSYDNRNLEKAVKDDLIEESIKTKLKDELEIDTEISVETDNGDIIGITVFSDYNNKEKITEIITQYCDINRNMVVVK